jgi:hypothetical protein
MCTVLTACSIVGYYTAGVRIIKMCVQFLLLVVLYGTVLQELELLKCVYSLTACSIVRYCTAGVRIVKICVYSSYCL